MSSLSPAELQTIYQTVLRAQADLTTEVTEISDLFAENPRLIISPSNQCEHSCLHCVADSNMAGEVMSYSSFTSIDPEFLKIFSVVDFGRRGNPLIYNSEGHDIVDILEFLYDNGINEFTLAFGLQNKHTSIIDKLAQFSIEREVSIEIMLTYHHYYDKLDTGKLAKAFNQSIRNSMEFSDKILISLLGDIYSQQNPTRAEEVENTFWGNQRTIFEGVHLDVINDRTEYSTSLGTKAIEIIIPPIDTRVYPFGRFEQYLSNQGILDAYTQQFEAAMSEYVCPDLVKWPGIIIEPNGDLNLCASFEAVNCNHSIISNLFTKPYSQVKAELTNFHDREFKWFIENLEGIMSGTVSTCKLKNHCYTCDA